MTTDDTRPLCGHWRVSPPGNQRGWCCEHCGQPFTPSPDPYSFTCRCGVTMDQSDASRHECAPTPDPLLDVLDEAEDFNERSHQGQFYVGWKRAIEHLRAVLAREEAERG